MNFLITITCFALIYCQAVNSQWNTKVKRENDFEEPEVFERPPVDYVKRAFNQNFKGAILEQNNIEQMKLSNFHGDINSQANIANEGKAKCRKRRGFNQNFHGTIGKQNNIESSKIDNHFGDINSQLNVENEIEECLPPVASRPLPNNRFRPTTEASFRQNFKGPVVEQNNLEKVKESNFFGDIRTQTNAQNNVQLKPVQVQKPNRRPYNQQRPYQSPHHQQRPYQSPHHQQRPYQRPYNHHHGYYRKPNFQQKPHGFKQTINAPIFNQKNYESHQIGNYYGDQNVQYNQRNKWY